MFYAFSWQLATLEGAKIKFTAKTFRLLTKLGVFLCIRRGKKRKKNKKLRATCVHTMSRETCLELRCQKLRLSSQCILINISVMLRERSSKQLIILHQKGCGKCLRTEIFSLNSHFEALLPP